MSNELSPPALTLTPVTKGGATSSPTPLSVVRTSLQNSSIFFSTPPQDRLLPRPDDSAPALTVQDRHLAYPVATPRPVSLLIEHSSGLGGWLYHPRPHVM